MRFHLIGVALGLLFVVGHRPFGRSMRDQMVSNYGRFIYERTGRRPEDTPARGYQLLVLGFGILMTLFGIAGLLGVISFDR